MARIHVMITTYRRREKLLLLCEDILHEMNTHDISVCVYDDATPKDEAVHILDMPLKLPVRIARFISNHGKERFHGVINRAFSDAKVIGADYYVLLQDDMRLKSGFFDDMIDIWESIDDECKASLNPFVDKEREGKPVWTGIHPIMQKHGEYELWRSHWVDCFFFTDGTLLEALDWKIHPVSSKRWERNPLLSSGVGQQMTMRLLGQGLHCYQTKKSYLVHTGDRSLMNPVERQKRPLRGNE